jgi:hypothetical protein
VGSQGTVESPGIFGHVSVPPWTLLKGHGNVLIPEQALFSESEAEFPTHSLEKTFQSALTMYERRAAASSRVCSCPRHGNEPHFFHGAFDAESFDSPAPSSAPAATRRRRRARVRQTPGSTRTARPQSIEVLPVDARAAESLPQKELRTHHTIPSAVPRAPHSG